MKTLVKNLSPDIKAKYVEEVPSVPKVLALVPLVVYLSLVWICGTLVFSWLQVRELEKQYPLDVAENDKLQASIDSHKANIAKTEAFYRVFIKWRAWFNESPPLSTAVSQVLQSINNDTRVNYLNLARSEDGPNQLKLTLRIAVTKLQATQQFDEVISSMGLIKYAVAGGIDQNLDNDAITKYPTPNGLAKERFHRLDVTFVDRNALPPLKKRDIHYSVPGVNADGTSTAGSPQ